MLQFAGARKVWSNAKKIHRRRSLPPLHSFTAFDARHDRMRVGHHLLFLRLIRKNYIAYNEEIVNRSHTLIFLKEGIMTRLSKTAQNVIIVSIAVAVLALGVSVVLIFSPRNAFSGPVGQNATSAQYNPQKVDGSFALPLVPLDGDWYMKEDNLAFSAKVEGPSIKIELATSDGYSVTYWHGTFKSAESPNTIITSEKTEGENEIVLSQDATKDFTVHPDGLTFKFSAMGFSKIVTLKR